MKVHKILILVVMRVSFRVEVQGSTCSILEQVICKTNKKAYAVHRLLKYGFLGLPPLPFLDGLFFYTSTSFFSPSVVIVEGDRFLFQHNSCHTWRRMASVFPSRLILSNRLAGLLVCVPWYQKTVKPSSHMQHKASGWDLVVEEWGQTSL